MAVAATAAWSVLNSTTVGEGGRSAALVDHLRARANNRGTGIDFGVGVGVSARRPWERSWRARPNDDTTDQLRYCTRTLHARKCLDARGPRGRPVAVGVVVLVVSAAPRAGIGIRRVADGPGGGGRALVGTRATLDEAVTAPGSVTTARAVRREFCRPWRFGALADGADPDHRLADYLDANRSPIDYRRRRAMNCAGLLPDSGVVTVLRRAMGCR